MEMQLLHGSEDDVSFSENVNITVQVTHRHAHTYTDIHTINTCKLGYIGGHYVFILIVLLQLMLVALK